MEKKPKRKWNIDIGSAELDKAKKDGWDISIGRAKMNPRYDVEVGPAMIDGTAEELSDEDTDRVIREEALKKLKRRHGG